MRCGLYLRYDTLIELHIFVFVVYTILNRFLAIVVLFIKWGLNCVRIVNGTPILL